MDTTPESTINNPSNPLDNNPPSSQPVAPGDTFSPDIAQELEQLERELRMTLQEVARLQNALAEANMKLMALTSTNNASSSDVSADSMLRPLIKELRQPLVTIRGYLELLLNESVGSLGAFQRRFVERIQKAVDHMEESFDSLSRSQEEEPLKQDLYSQSFSVKKTIEASLDLFISTIRSREIVLQINIPNEDIRLFEDKEKYEQILTILITNAIAAMSLGGSFTIDVEECLTMQPQQVLIKLTSAEQNTGQGEILPLLPEMYKDQRITLPGFGLPLEDIVRAGNMAKEMGGKIDLFTNGSGTLIEDLRLPLSQGEIL